MQTNVNLKVSLTKRKGSYVEGQYEDLGFSAKVYKNPSFYGIKGGRVSKLMVFENSHQLQMLVIAPESLRALYDREWVHKSQDSRISTIIEYLEKLS